MPSSLQHSCELSLCENKAHFFVTSTLTNLSSSAATVVTGTLIKRIAWIIFSLQQPQEGISHAGGNSRQSQCVTGLHYYFQDYLKDLLMVCQ